MRSLHFVLLHLQWQHYRVFHEASEYKWGWYYQGRFFFLFLFLASIELLHRSFYGSSQKMLQDVIFVWGGAPLCSSWWVPVLPRNSQGFGSFLLRRTLWLFVLSPWYRVAAKICLMGFPHWCRPKTWRVRIEFNLVHDTRLVFGDKM